MLTELKSLFDFHPKEQKGILGLTVLILVLGISAFLFERWHIRPKLHSNIPVAFIDSLHQADLRYQLELEQASLAADRDEYESKDDETPSYSSNRPWHTYSDDKVDKSPQEAAQSSYSAYPSKRNNTTLQHLEINSADSTQWLLVRGIGPYTAHKIMKYRQRLGGFISTEQLKEIYKIDPILFDTCGTQFTCNNHQIDRININRCDLEQLAYHPYLNKSQARTIISYREMHGAFSSINELNKVALLDQNTIIKISPYLTLE